MAKGNSFDTLKFGKYHGIVGINLFLSGSIAASVSLYYQTFNMTAKDISGLASFMLMLLVMGLAVVTASATCEPRNVAIFAAQYV
jgi:hypothetical protein